MAIPVRQTDFLGGELDPRLWGRTDLPVFARGARTLRNFFVDKRGAAVSRPGTTFCGFAKANSTVRLVPFVYADSQSFVLEFGSQYIRFWSQGALVLNGGAPYEVATPFLSTDSLRFVQSGDVLLILNGRHGLGPYELKRLGNTNWTLTALSYANLHAWFTIPPLVGFIGTPPSNVAATAPAILTTDGGTSSGGFSPGTIAGTYPADASHPAREWQYAVTALAKDTATGAIFETLPILVTTKINNNGTDSGYLKQLETNSMPISVDRAVTLRRVPLQSGIVWNQPPGVSTWTPVGYCYYRGRGAQPVAIAVSGGGVDPGYFIPGGGIFGFIGTSVGGDFVDVGVEPDYTRQPPQGTSPFIAGEFPFAATYFQDRLVLGGSLVNPARLVLSATADYKNFDPHALSVAGESLDFTMTSRKREEVRFLVPNTKLLVLTDSTVRSIAGAQGALDFDNVSVQLEEEVGCAELAGPLIVEGTVLFPRTKGFGIRALGFDWQRQGYVGADVAQNALHLFLGGAQKNAAGNKYPAITPLGFSTTQGNWRQLYQWAYAEDPWGVVWAVMNDGNLVSLNLTGSNAAWSRHDSDGWFQSVAAIPEVGPSGQLEDYVYVAVLRQSATGTNVYIERFASRVDYGTAFDGIAVDSALVYNGAPTQTLTGLTHLKGKAVYITGVGNPVYGPIPVDFTGAVQLPDMPVANNGTNVVLWAGLAFSPDLELLDFVPGSERLRQKTVTDVGFEVDDSVGLSVGPDFDSLVEWEQRQVSDSYGAVGPETDLVTVPVESGWDSHARAALRQTQPKWVTVTGVTRRLEAGDV